VTGAAGLERGYRRLLACYPARFRGEHGEELLAVLLAGARDGQRRPGLAESASLLRSGLGMRLRPDASQSARQGWADALAVFSLAGPVLLLATTVLVALARSYALGRGRYTTLLGLPGFWIMLGFQVAVAALVLAGLRRAALVMTAVYLLITCLSLYLFSFPFALWSPLVVSLLAINVCIVELAALLGSPGPRRGRDLVHWGHGVVLLLCAPALASLTVTTTYPILYRHPRITLLLIVIVVAVIARLARAVRLSRHFRLLLAALACPYVLLTASWTFGWLWLYTSSEWHELLFAGPVLAAAVALISTVRPRRRQII
jgi:hypothetical protein